MRNTQIHIGQSLERVQQCLDANASVVGAANQTDARKQLDSVVAKLRATVDDRGTRVREELGEMRNRVRLEQVLIKKYLKPLSRFARAQLKGVPNYAALTPSGNQLTRARLVNAARSMGRAALPYAAQITATKFPTDFLAQLGKAADAVAASITTLAETRRRRVGTTKQMDELLLQGRNAVHTLDSVVSYTIMGNAGLEAEWRNARRVTKVSGGRRTSDVVPAVAADTSAQEATTTKAA